MHKVADRWKYAALAAVIMALVVTAGCGGGGESGKQNTNIVGTWLLVELETAPATNKGTSTTITCPGNADGIACNSDQELVFAGNGDYAAYSNNAQTTVGVFNINGNVLTVQYHYNVAPSITYTDTYETTILVATESSFVNTMYAVLLTSTDPTSHAYLGATYVYGL